MPTGVFRYECCTLIRVSKTLNLQIVHWVFAWAADSDNLVSEKQFREPLNLAPADAEGLGFLAWAPWGESHRALVHLDVEIVVEPMQDYAIDMQTEFALFLRILNEPAEFLVALPAALA
jgi:hypothetical protein